MGKFKETLAVAYNPNSNLFEPQGISEFFQPSFVGLIEIFKNLGLSNEEQTITTCDRGFSEGEEYISEDQLHLFGT